MRTREIRDVDIENAPNLGIQAMMVFSIDINDGAVVALIFSQALTGHDDEENGNEKYRTDECHDDCSFK